MIVRELFSYCCWVYQQNLTLLITKYSFSDSSSGLALQQKLLHGSSPTYVIRSNLSALINGVNSTLSMWSVGFLRDPSLALFCMYLLYTCPFGDIIRKHDMNFHSCADDTQIYFLFHSSQSLCSSVVSRFQACLCDISKVDVLE